MLRHSVIFISALLLTNCSTPAMKIANSGMVVLPPWSAEDERRAAILITNRCGNPPVCPADAVLEKATLNYANLRAQVRAAQSTK